jgi:hypothetical protein
MRKIIILIACFGFAILHGQTSNVTIQTVPNYKGWKWDSTIVMQNGLITMATVPAIGGRVMQYDLNGVPSLFVNSAELGNTYTPANDFNLRNFGGFKNWPSPQDAWNWPPPPTLDYGKYAVTDFRQGSDSVSLTIISPIEQWRAPNIQFQRTATIFKGSTCVRMEQTIINTGTSVAKWGEWDISQSIVQHNGKTDYQNFWSYFPLNPKSVYGSTGVSPQGPSEAWKGEISPGIYGVQYYPDGQKIFADPSVGWLVYANLLDSVISVRTFSVFDTLQYPDGGARISVWVNPPNPAYMEVEVKGPVVSLAANGGRYTFTENWWAAKVRAPILDVDSVGAIANRLSYNSTTHCLSAIYGVFYQGTAKVAFIDAQGQLLKEGQPHTVSPLMEFQLQDTVSIPDSAKTIEIRIYNTKDELIGVLEKKKISPSF